jgi:hypothetical protein
MARFRSDSALTATQRHDVHQLEHGSRASMTWLGILVGFLAFLAACASPNLPGPSPSPSPIPMPTPVPAAPSPVPPPAANAPPLTGLATSYHFSGPLSYRVSPFTETSLYQLYENGAFALHYPTSPAGGGTAVGVYAREGDRIGFRFVPGGNQGFAIGTVNGDLLEIRYSEIMQHSDFEDAVYRRSR